MTIRAAIPALFSLFLSALVQYTEAGACDIGIVYGGLLYNFNLTRPSPKYPHGVLSEDGFYKVSMNDTTLWFQLCDGMIFNHNPPRCFGCQDCGAPTHCGMECSALVASSIGGYDVCTTVGRASNLDITLIDKSDPRKGVIIKMSTSNSRSNCSLSVSVFCDSKGIPVPYSLNRLGICDYATVLRHPSGCATISSIHGGGWGWFTTFIVINLSFLGGYLLVGSVYRYFFLGVRGVEVVPNLEFWHSLPQRSKSFLGSLMRRFRSESQGDNSSYNRVNF